MHRRRNKHLSVFHILLQLQELLIVININQLTFEFIVIITFLLKWFSSHYVLRMCCLYLDCLYVVQGSLVHLASFCNEIVFTSLVQISSIAFLLSQSIPIRYLPSCLPLHIFPVTYPVPLLYSHFLFHFLMSFIRNRFVLPYPTNFHKLSYFLYLPGITLSPM